VLLAGLLLMIGIVLTSDAAFARRYVAGQLGQLQITFKSADTLTSEERKAGCLVRYAGQRLATGDQAECYANDFIGLHVKSVANGRTYAQLGAPQAQLTSQVAQAQKANDPALPTLQKQLTDVINRRETIFKAETLRGLLLTSYGFSQSGARAGRAASATYVGAGLLFLLAIVGFMRALATPDGSDRAVPRVAPAAKRRLRRRKPPHPDRSSSAPEDAEADVSHQADSAGPG
jgi:hypothetical protein